MKKRGGVLVVIGIVILALIILALIIVVYFYNFYVFETVRICVGESVDSEVPCNSTQECIDLFHVDDVDISDAPDFIRDKFQEVLSDVVYCDVTCFVNDVRGVNPETKEIEVLDSCRDDENSIVVEIHGKEGIELLKWMRARG